MQTFERPKKGLTASGARRTVRCVNINLPPLARLSGSCPCLASGVLSVTKAKQIAVFGRENGKPHCWYFLAHYDVLLSLKPRLRLYQDLLDSTVAPPKYFRMFYS